MLHPDSELSECVHMYTWKPTSLVWLFLQSSLWPLNWLRKEAKWALTFLQWVTISKHGKVTVGPHFEYCCLKNNRASWSFAQIIIEVKRNECPCPKRKLNQNQQRDQGTNKQTSHPCFIVFPDPTHTNTPKKEKKKIANLCNSQFILSPQPSKLLIATQE